MQFCAAAKVGGCLLALPLIVTSCGITPYFGVAVAAVTVIFLLWFNRNLLPKSIFKSSLIGLAGIIPPLAVFFTCQTLENTKTYSNSFSINIWISLVSMVYVLSVMKGIHFFYRIIVDLFVYFMKGCSNQEIPDNSAATRGGSKGPDTGVSATWKGNGARGELSAIMEQLL